MKRGFRLFAVLLALAPGVAHADAPAIMPSTPPATASELNRTSPLACLTAAIYYEAGNEVREGQEAVAQVVLNRVRHPAYPKSVCGVIFQGSTRSTGCQFSFTCDGSLARRPATRPWQAAEAVARAALEGFVAAPVSEATHYHAYYVTPYWSASLDRLTRIGAHIFYKAGKGSLQGAYSGKARAAPARAASAGGAAPGPATFSVWGLDVAIVTPN